MIARRLAYFLHVFLTTALLCLSEDAFGREPLVVPRDVVFLSPFPHTSEGLNQLNLHLSRRDPNPFPDKVSFLISDPTLIPGQPQGWLYVSVHGKDICRKRIEPSQYMTNETLMGIVWERIRVGATTTWSTAFPELDYALYRTPMSACYPKIINDKPFCSEPQKITELRRNMSNAVDEEQFRLAFPIYESLHAGAIYPDLSLVSIGSLNWAVLRQQAYAYSSSVDEEYKRKLGIMLSTNPTIRLGHFTVNTLELGTVFPDPCGPKQKKASRAWVPYWMVDWLLGKPPNPFSVSRLAIASLPLSVGAMAPLSLGVYGPQIHAALQSALQSLPQELPRIPVSAAPLSPPAPLSWVNWAIVAKMAILYEIFSYAEKPTLLEYLAPDLRKKLSRSELLALQMLVALSLGNLTGGALPVH